MAKVDMSLCRYPRGIVAHTYGHYGDRCKGNFKWPSQGIFGRKNVDPQAGHHLLVVIVISRILLVRIQHANRQHHCLVCAVKRQISSRRKIYWKNMDQMYSISSLGLVEVTK